SLHQMPFGPVPRHDVPRLAVRIDGTEPLLFVRRLGVASKIEQRLATLQPDVMIEAVVVAQVRLGEDSPLRVQNQVGRLAIPVHRIPRIARKDPSVSIVRKEIGPVEGLNLPESIPLENMEARPVL